MQQSIEKNMMAFDTQRVGRETNKLNVAVFYQSLKIGYSDVKYVREMVTFAFFLCGYFCQTD